VFGFIIWGFLKAWNFELGFNLLGALENANWKFQSEWDGDGSGSIGGGIHGNMGLARLPGCESIKFVSFFHYY
jgi:hypothetical protein